MRSTDHTNPTKSKPTGSFNSIARDRLHFIFRPHTGSNSLTKLRHFSTRLLTPGYVEND